MDFTLGILAILQITALPGLIVYKLIRPRGNFLDGLLIVFGLSLFSNYCLIFLLSAVRVYTRGVFATLILVEIIVLLWLYRDLLRASIDKILTMLWDRLSGAPGFFAPKRQEDREASMLSFIWLVLVMLFAARSIAWASNVFLDNLGTVFSAWDAVVSWNRWATVWAAGQIPLDSHFYPQLIPANWSVTYLMLGDTSLQFFAKSISPLFALLILIGLLNLGLESGEYQFFAAMALLAPLLKHFLKDGVSNGYVDIAVAYWGFMSIYLLIKARRTLDFDQRYKLLLLGAAFAAGAAVTKQTGVYLALCYPILAWAAVGSTDLPLWKERLKGFLFRFAGIYVIWMSWYLFKEAQILMGTDRPNLEVLVNLSSDTYGNVGLFQQILAAMARFDKFIILFVAVALAFAFMDRFYRVLTALMLPYPLLWAWFAGYDTRNLAIFLPVFALLSGFSVDVLVNKLIYLIQRIKALRIPVYVPLVLGAAVLLWLGFLISPGLSEKQISLQKENFSPKVNQVLYDLAASENSQTKILTNYPMEYLPGLERYQVRFDYQDWNVFLAHMKNPDIEYLLIPNAARPEIKDYIDSKLADGSYELVLDNRQWKRFTLFRILNH